MRSPGSTLKPFIYGMAFEDGIVHPETLIDDRAVRYGAARMLQTVYEYAFQEQQLNAHHICLLQLSLNMLRDPQRIDAILGALRDAVSVRFTVKTRIGFDDPAVFDELIAKKEMPVTIGVFVMHGKVPALTPNALDRFNRSFEYDGLGDNYVRFLLEELLPEVEKKTTPDGRPIRLSHDGNDCCIGGASSGAICAFTAAWEPASVWASFGTERLER